MKFKKGNQLASTYKREIVIAIIQEMPKASTMALSRLLLQRNPLDFDNLEQCRTLVRYYRGEKGQSSSQIINVGVRTETEKKQFMRKKFDLPESDYKKRINMKVKIKLKDTPTLEEIKKKMQRQLDKVQNFEKTNTIYRKLLKDANYYENQFKPTDYKAKKGL